MSAKDVFLGDEAPFYQAMLGRKIIGQPGSADFSVIATQVIQLRDEVNDLVDEVHHLRKENQQLMGICKELETQINALERELRRRR
jgi:hypothetical protein